MTSKIGERSHVTVETPVTVWVTGASGQIGRRLVERLRTFGRPESRVHVQVLDRTELRKTQAPDQDTSNQETHELRVFLHLAGMANASDCERDPSAAEAINVDLTRIALECATRLGCQRFILASSGAVYGDRSQGVRTEDDALDLRGAYAKTKARAEALVSEWAESKPGRWGISLRMSNVYGPNSSEQTVIGRVLGQMRQGVTLGVSDPSPVRDFIYIEDVAAAWLSVTLVDSAKQSVPYEVFNVSTGVGVSVGELVGQRRDQAPDSVLVLSSERLKRVTGWSAKILVSEGLRLCSKELSHG